MLVTVLLFVGVLGLLVFVHELGHFLVAKKSGCQVDEFGFGFPPKIFGVRRGETEYTINLIPLGGFVRIAGEDGEEEKDNPRAFVNKPFWQRLLTLTAGVIMNFVLAALLLMVVFGLGFPEVIEDDVVVGEGVSDVSVQVAAVLEGSAADTAGLVAGDRIVEVNGESVNTVAPVVDAPDASQGDVVVLGVEREGGDRVEIEVLPEEQGGDYVLGLQLYRVGTVEYPWYAAIWQGVLATGAYTVQIVTAFGGLIVGLFQGQGSTEDLTGPIGIAVLTGEAARLGVANLLQFAAILSINLGIINILPLPALDGGRVLFLVIERIRGRQLGENIEGLVHMIGFGLFLLLMAFVTFKDVNRFAGGFRGVVDWLGGLF